MDEFFKILGINTAVRMLPHFIRTIDSKRYHQINDLDKIYLEEVKKLPTKFPNMLYQSKNYSDLMERMQIEIEKNIKVRIEEGNLDLSKPWKMERTRVI